MAKISAPDGVKLHVEEVGSGTPVVFVHEYAGDYRSWEPQLRYFCRQHRCVTYSQRGYPPSDVPSDPARYSQAIARDDVIAVMDALGIPRAHVVGHSMGAYTALHVGMHYPQRCISLVAAGCGWGSTPDAAKREAMKAMAAEAGKMFAEEDIASAAANWRSIWTAAWANVGFAVQLLPHWLKMHCASSTVGAIASICHSLKPNR